MLTSLITLAVLALQAGATTIPIAVGRFGLTFSPNTVQVAQGDVLEFRFWAKNHSVVQGTWDKACAPIGERGFFSGFFPTAAGAPNANVFRVTVNDTNPIIVYCAQNTGAHCKNGMAAVINANGNNNLDNYLTLAKNASTAVAPPSVFGGTVAQLPVSASAGTETATTTTSTSTSTAAASTTGTGTSSTSGSSASPSNTNAAAPFAGSLAGLAAAGAAAVFLI